MREIRITFEENGGEYWGSMIVKFETFERLTINSFKVNEAIIQIDEDIIDIEEIKKEIEREKT